MFDQGYDGFGKFAEACSAAGIDLDGAEYTVFVPTDLTIDEFVVNGGTLSADILKYHIVPGKVTKAEWSSNPLTTLQGESLTYRRMFRKDFVDNAFCAAKSAPPRTSYAGDIQADNGVIHMINEVIYPGWSESSGGYGSE